MKRMKKLTSIGLVLAMTVGLLAGCSGSGSGNAYETGYLIWFRMLFFHKKMSIFCVLYT